MKNLLTALVKAKTSFSPLKKDSKNPHFKSTYASLNAVLEAVEMPLLEQGILIVHTMQEAGLETALVHAESEERLATTFPITVDSNPQKTGSALSYARRYNLLNLLNLAAEDDDGSAASTARSNPDLARVKAIMADAAQRSKLGKAGFIAIAAANGLPQSSDQLTIAQAEQLRELVLAQAAQHPAASPEL